MKTWHRRMPVDFLSDLIFYDLSTTHSQGDFKTTKFTCFTTEEKQINLILVLLNGVFGMKKRGAL